MTQRKLQLGSLVSIVKGKKHDEVSNIPSLGSKRYIQIDDLRNNSNLKYTTNSGVEVGIDDVIIAWDGANAGTIGFGLNGYIGSTLARLRIIDAQVYSKFLGWCLRGQSVSIREKCTGATIPHVNKSFLQSIDVRLPPLPIQKQIAEILEKADTTREMRLEANELTQQFLHSAFLEMFGDGTHKRVKLRDVCRIITDGTHITPKYLNQGYPFVSVKDVRSKKIDFNNVKYISRDEHLFITKRCRPEKGDILYTKVGATFGNAGPVDPRRTEFSIFVSLALLKPKFDIIEPHFLHYMMNTDFVKSQARQRIKGIAVPDLHLIEIKDFDIYLPEMG